MEELYFPKEFRTVLCIISENNNHDLIYNRAYSIIRNYTIKIND